MYKVRKNETNRTFELVEHDEDGEEIGVINDFESLEDLGLWAEDILADSKAMYDAFNKYKEEHGAS